MRKSYLTMVLMLTCLLGIGVSARAQEAVAVNVPFEFVAGGITFPAGDYKINRVSPGTSQELVIRGYDREGAFLLPTEVDRVTVHEPTLSFEHIGGKYFLAKVKTLDGIYSMPTPRQMVVLGQMNTPGTMSASGTN